MRTIGFLGLAVFVWAGAAVAADWPQFLGPTRDGVTTETGLVEGITRGPHELWRRPLGQAYSGVAVSDGVLYTLALEGDSEVLVALGAGNGLERWRVRLGPAPENGGYPGPRATPTVVEDVVVALSSGGMLHAVGRADGRSRWTVDLVTTLGGVPPTWGYAASPLVAEGRVYLTVGGSSAGLVALGLRDGAVVWRHAGFQAAYASPILASLGGVPQVVFFAAEGLVGLRPADGSLVWQHPWTTNYAVNASTPVLIGGERLFVGSGYGVGGAALLVSGSTAVELWRSKSMKTKTTTPVLYQGHLYGFNEDQLSCVSVVDGAQCWSASGYGRGSLLLAGDKLIVLDEQCRLGVIAADPTALRVIAQPKPILSHGPCWTTPAVSNGVLYARDLAEVVALELRGYGPAAAP